MVKGPINYDIEVWCSHDGEKHSKTECKFIPNWGFKCPDCGGKCRVQPKRYRKESYQKSHPYIPRKRNKHNITTEIIEHVKESKRMV